MSCRSEKKLSEYESMSSRKDEPTFMDLLRQGKARPDDFDDFIGYWHEGRGGTRELEEYLGVDSKFLLKICIEGNRILWKYYNTERSKRVASKRDKTKT